LRQLVAVLILPNQTKGKSQSFEKLHANYCVIDHWSHFNPLVHMLIPTININTVLDKCKQAEKNNLKNWDECQNI